MCTLSHGELYLVIGNSSAFLGVVLQLKKFCLLPPMGSSGDLIRILCLFRMLGFLLAHSELYTLLYLLSTICSAPLDFAISVRVFVYM